MSHPPTSQTSRITHHLPLLVILFLFSTLTLYQSILLPLGEADDETDHYQYLRFVARTGHPPFTEAERSEAGFKGGLAPLYYWLTAWPIALVGEQSQPDIRRVDARPERFIPGDGLGINHVLHTLDEQWPWRGQILAWRLVRFLSLPLAWVTIIATYALARRLYPQSPLIALGAAAFVAFLPRFVGSSAVINDDNLVFALTSLLLLVQVIILQNASPSPRLFALFGALFGLALITKYFSLILVSEVVFTLVMAQVISRRLPNKDRRPIRQAQGRPPTADHHSTKPTASRLTHHASERSLPLGRLTLLPFLIGLLLTAGPWLGFIMLRFNRIGELGFIPGLAASLGEPQITEGLVGLLSGHSVRPVAATYSLLEWFSLLYRSFWFEFGWMRVFAPAWIYGMFGILLLLTLIGHILRLACVPVAASSVPRITYHVSRITFLLTLHFALFLIVVLARYVLSATIDTGQGRHLYPALPVIALFISLGLFYFGFWALDFGFKTLPFLATRIVPVILRIIPAPHHLQFSIFYFLFSIFFLLPAFILQPSAFIPHHYDTLPITTTPPDHLPIPYRRPLPFADGLALAGFDTPLTVSAGETLPVTLYWHAEREARQDYLVSLCLHDDNQRPAACRHGPFAAGRYPARAWESGDTVADTIFIPIPTCYRISAQTYQLHLEVWPLDPTSPEMMPGEAPVLTQTFAEPRIAIQASDSLTDLPQTVDIWRGSQRLLQPTTVGLGDTLIWLDYADADPTPSARFIRQVTGASDQWSPLPTLNTALFLPCDDSPEPFVQLATFIAAPTLLPGPYVPDQPNAPSNLPLSLDLRQRAFAPISSTLTFSHTLAPLSLEIPGQPPINLEKTSQPPNLQPSNLQPSNLPLLTLRWQVRRWMADPLIVSLKLLDKDFNIGAEHLSTLGDRYPNVLWVPTEVVEETYPLRLKPAAPPGLYRLEISLLREDDNLPDGYEYLPLTGNDTDLGHNLYPLTFRLLDPADGTPPPHPFSAQLGGSIQLTGFDLQQLSMVNGQFSMNNLHAERPISLALYWHSTAPLPTDYTVFTQLIGPDGQVWAQWDNPPQAGRYPTTTWTAQDNVVDRYTLTLRDGAPRGEYRLLVGIYDPATGQRLLATVNGQPQPDNAIELTTLTLDH